MRNDEWQGQSASQRQRVSITRVSNAGNASQGCEMDGGAPLSGYPAWSPGVSMSPSEPSTTTLTN